MKLGWHVLIAAVICSALAHTPLAPAAELTSACNARAFHEFDFWLGSWTVRNARGKLLGRNLITREQGGCVVLERWSGASSVHGMSVNAFDPRTGRWTETWTDSTGGLMLLGGGAQADGMRMSGETRDPRYGIVQNRIEWATLPGGLVRQHIGESRDGGRTWKDAFDGYSTRDASPAQTTAREVLTQRFPHLNGNALTLHVVDVTYPPGGSSNAHAHPCPVSVYVASGALRERIDGGPTRMFTAGQSFYEAPNHVHAVSANASVQEPAHFIASFLCDRQTELSQKVPQ